MLSSYFGSTLSDLGQNMIADEDQQRRADADRRNFLMGLANARNQRYATDTTAETERGRTASTERLGMASNETANRKIASEADLGKSRIELDRHIAELRDAAEDKSLASHERIAASTAANALEQIKAQTQGAIDVQKAGQQFTLDQLKANPLMGNPQLFSQAITEDQATQDYPVAASQAQANYNALQEMWHGIRPWNNRGDSFEDAQKALASLGDRAKGVMITYDPTGKAVFTAAPHTSILQTVRGVQPAVLMGTPQAAPAAATPSTAPALAAPSASADQSMPVSPTPYSPLMGNYVFDPATGQIKPPAFDTSFVPTAPIPATVPRFNTIQQAQAAGYGAPGTKIMLFDPQSGNYRPWGF